jgi:hypothetical protein
MMFECGIKIGMIPSCSGYEGMFRRSHINAAVVDKDNEYRYQSLNYDSDIDRENIRISEKAISGGKVIWMENLETIYSLNGMLSDAVEIVEAENTLIEKENAAKEESSRYEAQNRLYNSIAYFSNSKLRSIDKELFAKYAQTAAFASCLARRAFLRLAAFLWMTPLLAALSSAADARESCSSVRAASYFLTAVLTPDLIIRLRRFFFLETFTRLMADLMFGMFFTSPTGFSASRRVIRPRRSTADMIPRSG